MAPSDDHQKPASAPQPAAPSKKGGNGLVWILAAIFIVAGAIVTVNRMHSAKETRAETAELATPSVHVITPKISKADVDLVLPGNVEPFADTPIFARTAGYVKRWLVNIGTNVKTGQLLAEIDSPEIDQQLQEAEASLDQAQSNYKLAALTAERWKAMLERKTVSQQETDEKDGQLSAAQATVDSAKANVRRLQELKSFELVTAPFDGVITQRQVNVGDLISVGASNSESEMFRIAQDNVLRVFTNIPEVNSEQVKVGQAARVELASSPSAPAEGKVVHLAGAIDPASRTLLAEVQVDNGDHRLLAGGYAKVILPIHSDKPALVVPVNTLLFRPDGTVVGVVKQDNTVELKGVKIGRDFGTEVEIVSGIAPTDRIVLNPSDSLESGDHVQVQK